MRYLVSAFTLLCAELSKGIVIRFPCLSAEFPTKKKTSRFLVAILTVVTILAGCMPVGEQELCVSRSPEFEGSEGAFYELIDLVYKNVWGTPDFTAEEYAAFTPPLLWFKNDPRTMG